MLSLTITCLTLPQALSNGATEQHKNKMDAEKFIETLKLIDCPTSNNISIADVDQIFHDAELAPFLHWFSTEVGEANVLKQEEIERLDVDVSSVKQLKHEIENLEESLKVLKTRKDVLSRQKSKLTEHQSTVSGRVIFLELQSSAQRTAEQQLLKTVDKQNSDLNTCLTNLTDSVAELAQHYQVLNESQSELPGNRSEPPRTGLLSHLSLEKFLDAEQKYSAEITSFTRKQFFDGIAEIAKKTDGTRYEFLEVKKPETWLIQGDTDSDYIDNCRDLARISNTYVSSEMERVRARVDECSMKAAVEYYETMAAKLRLYPLPTDQSTLNSRLKEAETQHRKVNKELLNIAEVHIPQLLDKNSSLQNVSILQGDYDLKLSRQKYFTSNQDKLIEQLISQKSHSELLTMMLEIELCEHRYVRRLVTAVSLFLNELQTAFHNRLTWLSDRSKASDYTSRTTIDTRDKFILRLYDILETAQQTSAPSEQQEASGGSRFTNVRDQRLFVTYDLLNKAAQHAAVYLFPADSSRHLMNEADRISALEKSLISSESVLYEDGTRSQPVFTPHQLQESIMSLNNLLSTLEKATIDVKNDIEHKKKILQKDPLLSVERELFVYFHNDPQRLREIFTQLASGGSS